MIRRSKTLGGMMPQNRLGAASQSDPVIVTWEEEVEEERRMRRREKKRTVVLPHELVVSEVLARLACKPLMRFKCVSNLWRSSIEDHCFGKVHFSRSPSLGGLLLFVCPDLHYNLRFFYFTPLGSGLGLGLGLGSKGGGVLELDLVHHFTVSGKMYDGFTQVVDGLFCAYRGNRMWVCKVSTGGSIELPPCFNHPRRQKSRFYLGFDCTRKEYKLLRLCFRRDPGGQDYYFPPDCEILTLGKDAEWRSIPSGRSIDYLGETVFLHGNSTLFFWPKYGRSVLVAFSFKEEVFDVVVLLPWPFRDEGHRGSLLQFGDHLALVEEFFGQELEELELWVYGGKMPGEEENSGGNQDVDVDVVDDYVDDYEEEDIPWTKHIINFPYAFRRHGFSLLGYLPTGEMLMAGTLVTEEEEEINNSNNKSPPLVPVMRSLYSYDPTKEKFQELVIGNEFQTSPLPSIGTDANKLRIYQYVEDIRSLENLIRGDESNLGQT